MTDISTRIWLDEGLWEAVRRRAIAEGATVRELIPQLLGCALAQGGPGGQTGTAAPPGGPSGECTLAAAASSGTPAVPLAEAYICGVCGEELKLSRLSAHLGKHLKEQQASEA
ncbi:MAG: hypothetical protein ACYC5O_06225 [Anaerolineae bacterium]